MANRPRLASAMILALLAAPSIAGAEPRVPVELPGSVVAGDRALLTPSPGARGDALLRAALLWEHARTPLRLVTVTQESREIVAAQTWLHLAASFAFRHRGLVALHLPVLLSEDGDERELSPDVPTASGQLDLGDPRLSARVRVLGDADAIALGVGLRGTLPLATTTYAGSTGPSLTAFAALGQDGPQSSWSTSLAYTARRSLVLPGILPTRAGPGVELGAAFGVTLDRARRARIGPELLLVSAVGAGARLLDPRSTSCQLLMRVQVRPFALPLELGLSGGPALGRAPGAADYRTLLSLVFSPEEPAPPPDGDGDRVADGDDMCPSLAGVASEDPVMHGCPALPSDADGDGIPDTMDACPRTAGEPSVTRAQHGCPPAPMAPTSEPPAPAPTATLETTHIAISEQVQFATGTAILDPGSVELLRQIAAVLQQHPEILALEVAGHTDDTGSVERNRELSLARAQAVVSWLVAHGVKAERLSAQGYGATRPLAPNDSEEGRAQNRRVEFLITRRAAGPEAP